MIRQNKTLYNEQYSSAQSIHIKNGRVIDPVNGIDEVKDLYIRDGKMSSEGGATDITIDAEGKWVTPGLVDLNVNLGEPGREDKESITTGTNAAAAGGYTAIACTPNTNPVLDKEAVVRYVIKQGKGGAARIYPIGALTQDLEGKDLAPYGEMVRGGARAISEGGRTVKNPKLMRNVLSYSKTFDLSVFCHCEDYNLSDDGHMNESKYSTLYGMRGTPRISEEIALARDIMLAEYTGAKIHVCHVSTEGAVRLIRDAKKRGVAITCETAPHYCVFTDEAIGTYDTSMKVNPPLRSESDRLAIIEGIKDGTIDVIASDHIPHCTEEKDMEFTSASFGAIGLETSLAAVITHLVNKDVISPSVMVEKMSIIPNKILKTNLGSLSDGATADITIIDPSQVWTVKTKDLYSKARNAIFHDQELCGKATHTIVNGRIVYDQTLEVR